MILPKHQFQSFSYRTIENNIYTAYIWLISFSHCIKFQLLPPQGYKLDGVYQKYTLNSRERETEWSLILWYYQTTRKIRKLVVVEEGSRKEEGVSAGRRKERVIYCTYKASRPEYKVEFTLRASWCSGIDLGLCFQAPLYKSSELRSKQAAHMYGAIR